MGLELKMKLKDCPFCENAPVKRETTVECPSCKIALPVALWQGRIDSVHEIDGKRWMLDGHRIVLEPAPRIQHACLRSDMTDVMDGPWLPAQPDGYCRSSGIWCHRYLVDVYGEQRKCYVNTEYEKGMDVGGSAIVCARPFNGGFLFRYSHADEGPFMYLPSLVNVREQL
jgi:hypothetical protein